MKKTLLILSLIATIAITFFACAEREHTNPLDSDYWGSRSIIPVKTFDLTSTAIDQINLSWTLETEYHTGYKFRIDKKVGSGVWQNSYKLLLPSQLNYTDTAEMNQTLYYRIMVSFDENVSDYVEKNYDNIFQAPTGLFIDQTSLTSANLTWTDNSIGEEKFEIERKLSTESNYVKIAEIAGSNTGVKYYTDSVEPTLTYNYRIRGVKNTDSSAYITETYTSSFHAPTNLTVTQLDITSANLSWTDNSIGEEKFEIERKISTESTYAKIAEVTGSDTATKSWADTNLTQDLTYDYRVKAVKGLNSSAYITKIGYLNAFYEPTNFTATFVNYTSVTLTWADNYIGEDKFEVERKLSTESTYIKIDEVAGSDTATKTYTDSTIEPNLTYNFRVRIVDGTAYSSYASVTHANPFQAPTGLTASLASDTSIKLDWTDNSTEEEGFKIDRKIGAAGTWVTDYATVGANVKTYTNTGLTTGTTYYYRVRAYYSTYYSSYTSEVNAIPAAPAGFISIPTGSFSMGQTNVATPVHTVNITRPYYLGKYEVTQKEWSDIMGSNPSSGYGVGDNYPVYFVSWYSILVYCNKRSIAEGLTPCYTISGSTDPNTWGSVPTSSNSTWNAVTCNFSAKGYRLPTEAEWEYAARYNDGRTYPWGETAPSSTLCNYNSNVGATTTVGSYPSGNSNLGLCDMAGNVREWVWDWHATYPSTTQTDPSGPTTAQTNRVLRGGSWLNYSGYIRCAHRSSRNPSDGSNNYGLRLSRTK